MAAAITSDKRVSALTTYCKYDVGAFLLTKFVSGGHEDVGTSVRSFHLQKTV